MNTAIRPADDSVSAPFSRLLSRLHHDENGAASLETIMIIGAIALPILIFTIKVGWPRVKEYFTRGMDELEAEAENATGTV